MLTNKLKVKYNMKNINRDFDIYGVEKANKDYYKYNILDSPNYDFNALAVQWSFSSKALVLFRKGEVTERKFRNSLMSEYEDLKIQKVDIFNEDDCEKYFFTENRGLAQLLINSMKTPKHKDFTYNNITGKLFYQNSSWNKGKNFKRFLEVVIHPGMYLCLEHRTFRKCDDKGYGIYTYDSKTGEFRKKLKSDKNCVCYKKGSMPHNHFRVNDFNITDYAHYNKSKMGIMVQFLKDVEENLSDYIQFQLVEREDVNEYQISKQEKIGITDREYSEMLRKCSVVIVDENNTQPSQQLAEGLINELKTYYSVDAKVGTLSKDAYNIRIIHSDEYYDEKKIKDPHDDDLSDYVVQHIIEEENHFTNSNGQSPDIKKIIQELIIKGDVRRKQISIYDWKKLGFNKDLTFVIREKIRTKKDGNAGHINFIGNKSYNYYNYYLLKIDCNGHLTFENFCDGSSLLKDDWEKICCSYDEMEYEYFGSQNTIEGLVFNDINNIQAILTTKERTLPNIVRIAEALKQTDPKDEVDTKTILDAIEDFENTYKDCDKCIKMWRECLSQQGETVTKDCVRKILDYRKNRKFAPLFNKFLHENYGIWICNEMRSNEYDPIYQIGNLLNIKFKYNEKDYKGKPSFDYYVGAKSKKRTFPNGCIIRKVVTNGDHIDYEELLPLMSVDFVRNSQYTVIPFPYKYLREYIRQKTI